MIVVISVSSSTLPYVYCNKSLQGHYLVEAVLIFMRGRLALSMHLLDWLIDFIIQA